MRSLALTGASSTALAVTPARDTVDGAPVDVTDTLVPSAPPSSSVRSARSDAGSNDGGAVRAAAPRPVVVRAPYRARSGEPRVTARLDALVREREPSLISLIRERDPMPTDRHLSDALIEWSEARVRVIVGEWDGVLL